jgi:sec-independent protein translocase protein TatB
MFDIGWGELLLIGVVALIAIGPKELPGALRSLGQWMGKIRRMASEFQTQFQDAMREAELADLKKEVDDMTSQASKMANFDPLDDVRKEVEATQRSVESTMSNMHTDDEPHEQPSAVSATSSYGGPDTSADDVSPISAADAPASAEAPAVTAATNVGAATAEAAPTFAPIESPAPPPADTGVAGSATTAPAGKPDAGRAA